MSGGHHVVYQRADNDSDRRTAERKRQKVHLMKQYSIIPLYTHLQPVSFQRLNVCSHVQSCRLLHVPGIHCHVCVSSISSCAFVYFITNNSIPRKQSFKKQT